MGALLHIRDIRPQSVAWYTPLRNEDLFNEPIGELDPHSVHRDSIHLPFAGIEPRFTDQKQELCSENEMHSSGRDKKLSLLSKRIQPSDSNSSTSSQHRVRSQIRIRTFV